MPYCTETEKIYPIIEKYLGEKPIDIACGDAKVREDAFGIDGRDFPCVNYRTNTLYGLPEVMPFLKETFSSLYSGHTLEHLHDHYRAIVEWSFFLEKGGHIILYLPDGRYYSNTENLEHLHDTEYEKFLFWFKRVFCGEAKNYKGEQYATPLYELVESGLDVGEDRYSFFIVAQKL